MNEEGKLLFHCTLDSKYLKKLSHGSELGTERRLVFE